MSKPILIVVVVVDIDVVFLKNMLSPKKIWLKKMPQSGVGSMQGKNTRNMPSAVCASSINKSLDPTPI